MALLTAMQDGELQYWLHLNYWWKAGAKLFKRSKNGPLLLLARQAPYSSQTSIVTGTQAPVTVLDHSWMTANNSFTFRDRQYG